MTYTCDTCGKRVENTAHTCLPRFLTEEEQRRRVRVAALELEHGLLDRQAREDPDPEATAQALEDVRETLERIGRVPSYTEALAIEEQRKRKELA